MPRIRRLNFAACLFTLAALMVPVLLAGQAPPPAGGPGGGRRMNRDRVEERMQRMSERLNLTKEQQEKIRPIYEKQFQEMHALWQDTSLTRDQKRAKMQEMRKSTHEQVSQILTPEQREKLKEMRRSGYGMHHGGRMGQGPGQGQGPGGPPNQ